MTTPDLGGFQYTADFLSVLAKRPYSRQAIQGLWKRGREGKNDFPDRKKYSINGYVKYLFDMEDIREWYNDVSRDNTYGKRYR